MMGRNLGIAAALLAALSCAGGGGTPTAGTGSGSSSGSGSGSSGTGSSGTGSSGSGTSGGPSGVHAFLGTWTVSGNATYNCNATSIGTGTESGSPSSSAYNIAFAAGTSADLVSIDSAGCQLLWSVQGQTASMEPGQSCTITVSGGSAQVQIDSSSTISLTVVDANHLSGNGSGRSMLSGTDQYGDSLDGTCTASAVGTLIRSN